MLFGFIETLAIYMPTARTLLSAKPSKAQLKRKSFFEFKELQFFGFYEREMYPVTDSVDNKKVLN